MTGPAASVPTQGERLHEAAEHCEDLSPPFIRHDLLDQGDVADEPDPVAHAEDDSADTPDCEVGADGADGHARRSDEKRGTVAAVHRQPLDEPEGNDTPDQDAAGRERDEHTEADVACTVGFCREHDLRHVDAGVGKRCPAPDQEDRREVAVIANEGESGANLTPVGAADAGSDLRLEPVADANEEEGGDEEADRIQRVHGARAEQRDSDAGDHRAHQGGEVLGSLHERVRGNDGLLADEIGDRRVTPGAEERGREPRERRDGADARGRVNEREHAEAGCAAEVGQDHHPLARPAIDQWPHRDPEDDAGNELCEEQDADPPGGVRLVVERDADREERRPRAEGRDQPGEQEVAVPAVPGHADDRELRGELPQHP